MLYLLAFVGSFVAGVVNVFAGNGSSITLYMLLDLFGLSGPQANATNRLGIFFGGLTTFPQLHRENLLYKRRNNLILFLLTLGAILGAWVALYLSSEAFKEVFKYLLVLTLVILFIKPERWLRQTDQSYTWPLWLSIPAFLALGFYGGFIQLGMGLYFLMVAVLGLRYSMIEANAIKIVATTIYTGFALLIFIYMGQVEWGIGLVFVLGQGLGGWLGAKLLTQHPRANIWAYRILVAVIVLALARLFGLWDWLYGQIIELASDFIKG